MRQLNPLSQSPWPSLRGLIPGKGAGKDAGKGRGKAGGARTKSTQRRAIPGQTRKRVLSLATGTLCLAVVAGAAWLEYIGWYGRQIDRGLDAFYRMTADSGLSVQDVLVTGRQRTAPSRVLATLDVARGTPILAVDPTGAKARLETLHWVHRATVERRLPEVLFIRLVERQPLALWQLGGKVSVVDDRGEVLAQADPADFAELPLIVGAGAPLEAAALLRVLESEPDLHRLVTAAVRVGGRRWNLQLEEGVEVRLPEAGAEQAWAELARIVRQHGLLERDVAVIDLRIPDRMVVRAGPGADRPADEKGAGKDT
jgi:cell division protein FtsQ